MTGPTGSDKRDSSLNSLGLLKEHSVVVADTGDFAQISTHKPQDATTNPTLLLQASLMAEYKHLLDEAIDYAKKTVSDTSMQADVAADKLAVNFGCEILKLVPGLVSTEVNPALSFDKEASVKKAREIIALYEAAGVSRDRILIKMATTWEGCQAAAVLEKEGIHCNMTLIFGLPQARAAAEAKAYLVSPFVGRVLDWYKQRGQAIKIEKYGDHPGVKCVVEIYNYYKAHGFTTQVMGASFRTKEEVIPLAGCDKLTIPPKVLADLGSYELAVPRVLTPPSTVKPAEPVMTEAHFRWSLNEDHMGSEMLANGIRSFDSDTKKLKAMLMEMLKA